MDNRIHLGNMPIELDTRELTRLIRYVQEGMTPKRDITQPADKVSTSDAILLAKLHFLHQMATGTATYEERFNG
mgnify:CR=1 FL=1